MADDCNDPSRDPIERRLRHVFVALGRIGHTELAMLKEVAELENALRDAVRTWTFDDYQHPSHSWHDREDWFGRHQCARDIRRTIDG